MERIKKRLRGPKRPVGRTVIQRLISKMRKRFSNSRIKILQKKSRSYRSPKKSNRTSGRRRLIKGRFTILDKLQCFTNRRL